MRKIVAVFLLTALLLSFAACSFGQKNNFADKTLKKFYLEGLHDFLGTDFKREKDGIDYLLRFSCTPEELLQNANGIYGYILNKYGEVYYEVSKDSFAWFSSHNVALSASLEEHKVDNKDYFYRFFLSCA